MSSDKKPLSKKKRGYLLAILGGSFGGPFGWITSPLVLYVLNKKLNLKMDLNQIFLNYGVC